MHAQILGLGTIGNTRNRGSFLVYPYQPSGPGSPCHFNMEPMAIEEMTAINRKRERDDKIGKLMGEYLLQGYKMLGSTCSICGVSSSYIFR